MEPEITPKKSTIQSLKPLIVLVVVGIVGYYLLSFQSANSITVSLESYEWEYTAFTGMITFDVEVVFAHSGFLECTLENREMTLYINSLNCGTKGFTESWEKYYSNGKIYNAPFVVFDAEDAEELYEADNYEIVIKLKAKAKSGLFSGNIEKTYSGSWSKTTY